MIIDSADTFSPELLQALKKDIFSSLRVALPGIVQSYDPETRTASVQPAVRSRIASAGAPVPFPLLREVPVFAPRFSDDSIRLDIRPGDMCLLIFADVNTDGWYETGTAAVPPSGRRHDLSDAFAFAGIWPKTNRGDAP